MELITSFSRQKTSEKIINEFIFQNTGSIRKHGNDEIQKLITKHNIQQVEQNKSTASIVLRKFGRNTKLKYRPLSDSFFLYFSLLENNQTK